MTAFIMLSQQSQYVRHRGWCGGERYHRWERRSVAVEHMINHAMEVTEKFSCKFVKLSLLFSLVGMLFARIRTFNDVMIGVVAL